MKRRIRVTKRVDGVTQGYRVGSDAEPATRDVTIPAADSPVDSDTLAGRVSTARDFKVTASKTFSATSPADALRQMAAWIEGDTSTAEYSVANDTTGTSVSLHAEELDDEKPGWTSDPRLNGEEFESNSAYLPLSVVDPVDGDRYTAEVGYGVGRGYSPPESDKHERTSWRVNIRASNNEDGRSQHVDHGGPFDTEADAKAWAQTWQPFRQPDTSLQSEPWHPNKWHQVYDERLYPQQIDELPQSGWHSASIEDNGDGTYWTAIFKHDEDGSGEVHRIQEQVFGSPEEAKQYIETWQPPTA